ncbi:DNA-binding response regulator [Lactococcus hodotermopsidis]|uniref:DNA-binding response regulator n=1 Tax=Pseudolactococcus hodotermopsidis TaxID=2709157 RepID=A0A6A0BBE5_9LACT|nr:response regulator transcription factor [Lactococcus hodotermopsidis]GFH42690.1 DNA-binding response regulator [Lactococcus hodotermopsidis]
MYKVMLVDDEYMILEGLKYVIDWRKLGFEVVKTARNADEALTYLKTHTIDLLMLDVNMPEMTGIELLANLQKNGQRLDFQVLILSGYQEFNYVKEAMALGVKRYLLKPVDADELEKSVCEMKASLLQKEAQLKKYRAANLLRLLEGKLDEVEFKQLLADYRLPDSSAYTPILIDFAENARLDLLSQEKMILTPQKNEKILIFRGERLGLQTLLKKLEKSQILAVFVGQTVNDWRELSQSFKALLDLQAVYDFYPKTSHEKITFATDIATKEKAPSFVAFNQAISENNLTRLRSEISAIIQQIERHKLPPDYVHYLAGLLVKNVFENFDYLEQTFYEVISQKVSRTKTMLELKTVLENFTQDLATSELEMPTNKAYSEAIVSCLTHIKENIKSELTLKNVAEALYMNPVYLGYLFKNEIGISFSQYVNKFRMKIAENLLIHSNETITEIAESVGYNNTNYFSKIFKNLHDMTPKEFRDFKKRKS